MTLASQALAPMVAFLSGNCIVKVRKPSIFRTSSRKEHASTVLYTNKVKYLENQERYSPLDLMLVSMKSAKAIALTNIPLE